MIGEKSNEIVVEKYIPLVKYIAGRVILGKNKYIEYEDLVGYGMVGLMDAISKFDEEKGMKFSTYASIRIRGAMIDEMRRNSPISKGAMDKLNKYNKALETLQNRNFREPNKEEIAKELNISEKEVSEVEGYINYISISSLDSIIYGEDDISIKSLIEDTSSIRPDYILEEKEEIEILKNSIEQLSEKDKIVLNLYYYEGLTLKEIGAVLEVSESRVCQLHSRAILNLRKLMKKAECFC
ncbi:FliA/WhiG family RNA polymerase sigma factor [Clostridium sp.]|uniref:FliA/WhiG family RNA polymerase sigma factor n=1 Tax=Clostridium sp. TaxID=1506 RepID=UPI0039963419